MNAVSLASYTLRVKARMNIDHQPYQLNKFNGSADIFEICRNFLSEKLENPAHDVEQRQLIKVSKLDVDERTLTGIIERGEYGFESDLHNIESGDISYRRQTQDAEMIPFYFLFHLPKETDEGIVILQRFRTLGIRRTLSNELCKYFSNLHSDFRVEINPLVPESILKQYQSGDGRITQVKFVRYSIPADLADLYSSNDHIEETGYMELTIHPRRGSGLPLWNRLSDIFKNRRAFNRLIELDGFQPDNVKVEIERDGKRRTLDLSNPGNFRAYYDITDKLTQTSNGHPTYNEIDALAKELLSELNNSLRGGSFNGGKN